MFKLNSIFTFFVIGGPFMYPLLLLLFIGVFFIIERIIVYTRFDWNTSFDSSSTTTPSSNNSFLTSINENYQLYKNNSKKFNDFMELDCRKITAYLENNLNYLSAVSTIAPITGFLGTVTGMIVAFRDIIQATDVSPQLVANGIHEALITTAGGLIITICTSFFYFIFSGILKGYRQKIEQCVNDVYKQIDKQETVLNEIK